VAGDSVVPGHQARKRRPFPFGAIQKLSRVSGLAIGCNEPTDRPNTVALRLHAPSSHSRMAGADAAEERRVGPCGWLIIPFPGR
jgi:hypothetical protein